MIFTERKTVMDTGRNMKRAALPFSENKM